MKPVDRKALKRLHSRLENPDGAPQEWDYVDIARLSNGRLVDAGCKKAPSWLKCKTARESASSQLRLLGI